MHYSCWIVRDTPDLLQETTRSWAERFGEQDLVSGAALGIRLSPPWVPRDLFRHAQRVPILRTLALVHPAGRGRLLTDEALDRLVRDPRGSVERGAEPFAGDAVAAVLSRRIGGVLVLAHRDRTPMAYSADFRQGRCVRSTYYVPGERLARFDGVQAACFKGHRVTLPEQDRAGVLLLALKRFVFDEWQVDPDERLMVPELLGWGPEEGDLHEVLRRGAWLQDAPLVNEDERPSEAIPLVA
jgi:hypothetical protein